MAHVLENQAGVDQAHECQLQEEHQEDMLMSVSCSLKEGSKLENVEGWTRMDMLLKCPRSANMASEPVEGASH